MRQGQPKRLRGRSRGSGGGGGGGKGPNPLTRSYESNGPDVKIRGTAATIADKYVQLSRDAASSGDPVAAENYLQHAEHYYRLLAAAQAQYQPHQTFVRADADDFTDPSDMDEETEGEAPQHQPSQNGQPQHQQHNGGHQQNQNRFNGQRPNNNGNNGYSSRDGGYNGNREGGYGQSRNDNRYDRNNDRRDNRYDRSDNRSSDRAQERGPRDEREAAPAEDDQPMIGLPSFITGGGEPAAKPPVDQPEFAAESAAPVTAAPPADQPEAEASAGEEPQESRGPSRSRRRRYGRYGRASGAEGEGGEISSPPPETSGD